MEAKLNNRKNIIVISIFLLLSSVIIINGVMVNRINTRFVDAVQYNNSKGHHCEDHEDYYITAGKASFFGDLVTASVAVSDVYYSEENETITITLNVWADKYGKCIYSIGFCDYDEGKEEFGGHVYVDEDLNPIPEEESNLEMNTYLQKLLDDNKKHIVKLATIANERWQLELNDDLENGI